MQTFNATVISAKIPGTVTVVIAYTMRHPKYKKIIRRRTKLMAHNGVGELTVGDKVEIVKTRPLSRRVHFAVSKIIAKAGTQAPPAVVPSASSESGKKPLRQKAKGSVIEKIPKSTGRKKRI